MISVKPERRPCIRILLIRINSGHFFAESGIPAPCLDSIHGREIRVIEKCRIRLFESGDLPRLHEIRVAAYEPVFQSFRNIVGEETAPYAVDSAEREQEAFLNAICHRESHHEVYVVEHEDEIVGFSGLALNRELRIGEIDLNAVHPDYQNDGIGAWMYSFLLDRMREEGMEVATVGTGGDESHAPARRAYEKAGFGPGIPSVYLYRLL